MPHTHPSLSLLDALPLTKGPSLWLPPPVEMPLDVHPLPDDVTAYFVYPYSLETHVLSPHPPALSHADQRTQLAQQQSARQDYLRARDEDKERRRKETLRRVAPGWEGSGGGALEPKRMSIVASPPPMTSAEQADAPLTTTTAIHPAAAASGEPPRPASLLEELASLQVDDR